VGVAREKLKESEREEQAEVMPLLQLERKNL
jgi:hypothetical protein